MKSKIRLQPNDATTRLNTQAEAGKSKAARPLKRNVDTERLAEKIKNLDWWEHDRLVEKLRLKGILLSARAKSFPGKNNPDQQETALWQESEGGTVKTVKPALNCVTIEFSNEERGALEKISKQIRPLKETVGGAAAYVLVKALLHWDRLEPVIRTHEKYAWDEGLFESSETMSVFCMKTIAKKFKLRDANHPGQGQA